MPEETTEVKAPTELETLIEKINEESFAKAAELAILFGCQVEPAVFIADADKKDLAVAFVRKPDPIQTIKLLRILGEKDEHGIVDIVKAQLIRDEDLKSRNAGGTASDPRFYDKDGKFDPKDTEINTGLLLTVQKIIGFAKNQFKKK